MKLSRRGLLGLIGGAAVAATGAQAKPIDLGKVEPDEIQDGDLLVATDGQTASYHYFRRCDGGCNS